VRKALATKGIIRLEVNPQGCLYGLPSQVPNPYVATADTQNSEPGTQASVRVSRIATDAHPKSLPEIGKDIQFPEAAEPVITSQTAVAAIPADLPAPPAPEAVPEERPAEIAKPGVALITDSAKIADNLACGTGSAQIAKPDTPTPTLDAAISAATLAESDAGLPGSANIVEPEMAPSNASANIAEPAVPAMLTPETAPAPANPTETVVSRMVSGSAQSAEPALAFPVSPADFPCAPPAKETVAPPATIEDQLAEALQKLIPGKPTAGDIRRLLQLVPGHELLLQRMRWLHETGPGYTHSDLALSAIEFNCRRKR